MRFPFYIALRYLFSKKKQNVINIISIIAATGIGVGAFALIVVLSAFNGLEKLVESLYSSFDPDIKITATQGKILNVENFSKNYFLNIEDIEQVGFTIEETVLLSYREKQTVAILKGVESNFSKTTGLNEMIVEGDFVLEDQGQPFMVLGYGLSYYLSLFVNKSFDPVKVYAPKKSATVSLNPENAFIKKNIIPSGIFSINPDFDNHYALVPMSLAKELLQFSENEVSSIEITIKKGADATKVKNKLQAALGESFQVKTRYELNEIIYKTNNTEKWITFLILTFIIIIAAFNLIGALTMLIIDKKQDVYVLKALGINENQVRTLFLMEGTLISLLGGTTGLFLGGVLCWLQQTFGLVKLEGIVVETYPILMKPFDFIAVLSVVLLIGFVSSLLPVIYALRK
jgi:lipoprotein-releasing system permease protein